MTEAVKNAVAAEPITDEQVAQWRKDTPGCANRIHLDNAGSGLMPQAVLNAITGHLNREANFGGYESADEAAPSIAESYASVARLIGAQTHNIAVVENSTVAFFQALSAFDFQPGDVIVTTRNDYISNQLAYLSLAQRRGVQVARAADLPSGGVDPQSVRELLRKPRARLLAVTWVPTNSGLIQPVETLGEIAESAGVPYLIDACQAAGEIAMDVAKLRCDFLSAAARKFLRGPRGLGFLYVSDRALKRGDYPLYIDMRGASWVSPDSFEPVPDARRFENWEFPYSLVLGLGEAARYAAAAGVERCGRCARELAATLRRKLKQLPGFRVLDRGQELAAIVTVEIKGWHALDVVSILRQQGINTSASRRAFAVIDMDEKAAASAVRFSPHYYNTEAEIDAAVEAVKALPAKASLRSRADAV
ncbi:MAG TPA: aminotransferase class V-fold PLP-dependent enzyme [Candidatus Cybelea sp.]|nr:aminotransferase class V-fold PLP-dependent enzyme [Candidatus Cybelea sp.]